jgi:hypothetical protein
MSYLIQQPSVLGEEIFTCGESSATFLLLSTNLVRKAMLASEFVWNTCLLAGDCCALDRKDLPYTASLTCNNRQVHLMCLEWAPECWYTAGIYGGC